MDEFYGMCIILQQSSLKKRSRAMQNINIYYIVIYNSEKLGKRV